MSETQPSKRSTTGDSAPPARATDEVAEEVSVQVGNRQVVVSVRFPREQVERIKACATVLGISSNKFILDGLEALIAEKVGSEEFAALAAEHITKAERTVAIAMGVGATAVKGTLSN